MRTKVETPLYWPQLICISPPFKADLLRWTRSVSPFLVFFLSFFFLGGGGNQALCPTWPPVFGSYMGLAGPSMSAANIIFAQIKELLGRNREAPKALAETRAWSGSEQVNSVEPHCFEQRM